MTDAAQPVDLMKYAPWLSVIISLIALVVSASAAYFNLRAQQLEGSRELAHIKEEWKEKMRFNIAAILYLSEILNKKPTVSNKELFIRRCYRTILMLTPGRHDPIYNAIKAEMDKHSVVLDETVLKVARPALKATWAEIEQHMAGRY
jgi:hypothetical protein